MLMFYFKLTIKLSKNTGINKHGIKLVEDQWQQYEPIHSLIQVELETLKT